jgi:Domain of unknown function (DUF6048)
MPRIYLFCINVIICCLYCINVFSQTANDIKDTIKKEAVGNTNLTLKKLTKTSDTIAIKNNNVLGNWMPVAYYVGIDAAKAVYNIVDKDRLRLECLTEAFLKNTNWFTIQVGMANAKFASNLLQYSSNSSGMLLSTSKSLFPFNNATEMDNAFVGIGYGVATNQISEAKYKIADVWGVTNGVIPSSNKIAHFAELNLGFRVGITQRLMASWRIQGKAILNNNNFNSIAPIYIANYGSGDKSTSFGYNFVLTYRVK